MNTSSTNSSVMHCLGPAGTFSESAAKKLAASEKSRIELHANLSSLVSAVRASGGFGVIPYYNLLEGLVQEGLDLIFQGDLQVVNACRVPIQFVAASRDGTLRQSSVASHPKALAQCSGFLSQNLPDVPQIPASSTSDAALQAANQSILAICSDIAAKEHGLKIVQYDVGNRPGGRVNFTDFLLVCPRYNDPNGISPESNNDQSLSWRTLVSVSPQREHPGLLAGILQQFAFYGINIAKIHSRPSLVQSGTSIEPQMFYLEVVTHPNSEELSSCVNSLIYQHNEANSVRILGCWPELEYAKLLRPAEPLDRLDPVMVVGVNGGFGKLIATTLIMQGLQVSGIDLQDRSDVVGLSEYYKQDIGTIPADVLISKKWVVLCTPEKATIAAILALSAPDTDLFVTDILSVKTPLSNAVSKSDFQGCWLSLHPMFAPSLSFRGQNVCVIPLRGEDQLRKYAVEYLLDRLGSFRTTLTANEHDKVTSVLQTATHATLLSLGLMMLQYDADCEVALKLSTPINQALLCMLARMVDADDELYQSMQVDNPFAQQARKALIDAMISLDEVMRTAAPGTMHGIFADIRDMFGEDMSKLTQKAANIATTIAVGSKSEN